MKHSNLPGLATGINLVPQLNAQPSWWYPNWKGGALLLLLAAGMAVHAAPVTTLKVMQFNIKVNASLGLNAVEQAIRNENPDIVTLQEADGYTIQPIASSLGGYCWTQTGGAGQYGIISRYPIIKRIGETVDAYGGVGVTIELSPNQRVHVFSAHLNYTPYGPYQLVAGTSVSQVISSENSARMPGLNELLGTASPFIGGTEPVLLTGDFNAPSDLDYSPAVAWPESVACRNAGLVDSYAAMHSITKKYAGLFLYNDPGITWTPLTQYEPNGCFDRIDFVYYSANDGMTPTSSTEVDSRNDNVNPWPSDHRALLSTFSLALPPQQSQASSPVPANGNTTAPLRPALTWVPGTSTTSHNVYFGTTSPGNFVGNVSADSLFNPGRLAPNTTYYWRVDEVKSGGNVTGNVWSFKTGNFSWADPGKANYAKNETITVNFGNGPGNKADWIGIYAAGSAYGPGNVPSIKWNYLNGTQTAPKRGVKSGSITFAGGMPTAGNYVIRFFSNDGFFLLDEVPITVGP
ncbi:MAG TPA: endonuclease/exonuclease/phosphatase family protein [Desulfuromonadaceae bacterium]|nr:endonuclease/exonuclease/phosphatase family protein [Desulfuromonadaceae bacterium]